MTHPARIAESDLLRDCQTKTGRRGGPGGQHRNKVETAVVVTHVPTGIAAEANERRSQAENLKVAVWRIRMKLACEIRTEGVVGDVQPSDLWQERLSGRKLKINSQHSDYPSLVAEALDAIAICAGDVRAAAEQLGTSQSQLCKLLREHYPALSAMNKIRTTHSLHTLK